MNNRIWLCLICWERAIWKALNYGQGKYKDHSAYDLHQYVKIISLINEEKYNKAFDRIDNLDTVTRDDVPNTIYNFLQKESNQ